MQHNPNQEHSGDSNEFYTQSFLSHTDEFCKDETPVCGYNITLFGNL